jgi:hypothetical protein
LALALVTEEPLNFAFRQKQPTASAFHAKEEKSDYCREAQNNNEDISHTVAPKNFRPELVTEGQ